MQYLDVALETRYAHYELTQAAFDGSRAYVLMRVTPLDDADVLMSTYLWSDTDVIPGTDETFAQRAARTGGRIIMAGIGYPGYCAGMDVLDQAAMSERYEADGLMLLFAEYTLAVPATGPVEQMLRIQDCVWGAAQYDTADIEFELSPTVPLRRVERDIELEFAGGMLTGVQLRSSELGTYVCAQGQVDMDVTRAEVETLNTATLTLLNASGEQLPTLGGGVQFTGADGEYVAQPEGGGSVILEAYAPADASLTDGVALELLDYAADAVLARYELPAEDMTD